MSYFMFRIPKGLDDRLQMDGPQRMQPEQQHHGQEVMNDLNQEQHHSQEGCPVLERGVGPFLMRYRKQVHESLFLSTFHLNLVNLNPFIHEKGRTSSFVFLPICPSERGAMSCLRDPNT